MSPFRLLFAVLLLCCGVTARADEPHDLLAHVAATITARLPLLAEVTVETESGAANGAMTKGTISLKRFRPAPGGYGIDGASYGVRGDVPAFLMAFPNALADPLTPAPETVDAAKTGKSQVGMRARGKEQVDGEDYDVVEITQAPNQALEPAIGGPITLKSVVRKLYIGHDGLVYRIVGDVVWTDGANGAAGNGAAVAMPLQSAHFVLKVTSYRQPVVFAPRPASQPVKQVVWGKPDYSQGQCIVAVSQDGRLLAVGDQSGDIHLIDITTAKETAVLRGHLERITALAFSPDAKRLISADSLVIAAWNIDTGKPLYTLHDQAEVRAIAVTPDGQSVLTVSANETGRLRDLATGRMVHTLDKAPMGQYRFSPDGASLADVTPSQVILWNTRTWQSTVIDLHMVLEAFPVAFSPDSARIAFSGYEHTLYVYDARSGREIKAVKGAAGGIGVAWFSADGKTLTALDADQRGDMTDVSAGLTTWDAASWQMLRSIKLNGGDHVQEPYPGSAGNTFVLKDRLVQLDIFAHTIREWQFPILPVKP
jgi:WD40 repeat protein